MLGLVSFLLVLFYKNNKIINFSLIVIFLNRFSDFILLLRFILFINYVNLNLFNNLIYIELWIFLFRLILKRAQYPFNLWLPLAIVAPIPVSSLVHSSTLVVVGLYFLFRFYAFININLLFYFSFFTLLFYGYNLIISFDFKKIIALSTINHISIIILFIWLKLYIYIYLYILIHALFKSIIFICIGILIYFNFDIQDIRKLNLINLYIPFFFFFFYS